MVHHNIHGHSRNKVLSNRDEYTGLFLLTIIEMLKYAVKEDYDNCRSEINLIPVEVEYT